VCSHVSKIFNRAELLQRCREALVTLIPSVDLSRVSKISRIIRDLLLLKDVEKEEKHMTSEPAGWAADLSFRLKPQSEKLKPSKKKFKKLKISLHQAMDLSLPCCCRANFANHNFS
jgi:hypothetical protein